MFFIYLFRHVISELSRPINVKSGMIGMRVRFINQVWTTATLCWWAYQPILCIVQLCSYAATRSITSLYDAPVRPHHWHNRQLQHPHVILWYLL